MVLLVLPRLIWVFDSESRGEGAPAFGGWGLIGLGGVMVSL